LRPKNAVAIGLMMPEPVLTIRQATPRPGLIRPPSMQAVGGTIGMNGWLRIRGRWFARRPSLATHATHLLKKHPEATSGNGRSKSTTKEKKMSGKLAYVTGGMGGIGTSICQRLAKEGYTVVAGCGPSRN